MRQEHQRQGAANITVRNIITSMRAISSVDWAELFEEMSLVDAVLRAGSNFAFYDFPTRNRYRSAIEALARGSRHSELDIAQEAMAMAHNAGTAASSHAHAPDARLQEPGYYLISHGRPAFEKLLGYRPGLRDHFIRFNTAPGILGYLFAAVLLSAAILAIPLYFLAGFHLTGQSGDNRAAGPDSCFRSGLCPCQPHADELACAPNPARAAMRGGVPEELRTMVVIPTLLTTHEAIQQQIEQIGGAFPGQPEGERLFRAAVRLDGRRCRIGGGR